jgi:hypothetical protein
VWSSRYEGMLCRRTIPSWLEWVLDCVTVMSLNMPVAITFQRLKSADGGHPVGSHEQPSSVL